MHTRAIGTITAPNCMVQAWDVNTGRQLLQDITTKMNADQSILAGNIGPNTLRQSILGYNQGNNGGRTLLQDITTKMNADRSILAGNIGPDTIHKSVLPAGQEPAAGHHDKGKDHLAVPDMNML